MIQIVGELGRPVPVQITCFIDVPGTIARTGRAVLSSVTGKGARPILQVSRPSRAFGVTIHLTENRRPTISRNGWPSEC
jgi:hypothetical protein